jgi:hypothetical protein
MAQETSQQHNPNTISDSATTHFVLISNTSACQNHLVPRGGKLEFAHFPNRGLISLVVVMKDGRTAEAGIVGNEGLREH